jgi:hypothetical protein
MAEVLVKIVIELLSILSTATKEVKRRRASELTSARYAFALQSDISPEIFARRLLGRTDIEDALKRLDLLIQEEVQMAIAQILKATSEVKDQLKDGKLPSPVANISLNAHPPRCRQNQQGYASDVKGCGGSKVYVVPYPYRLRRH